jgi:hypothetical protein
MRSFQGESPILAGVTAPTRIPTLLRLGAARGNARLTATTAVVLLALLAVEGATIPFLDSLLRVHVFVGAMLLPPVLLKVGSTGYRFLRYSTGGRAYRLRGTPPWLLRAIAPLVIVSTLTLVGTGFGLLATGPGGGFLLGLHTASFIVWFVLMSVHVLGHVLELPRAATADLRRADLLGGSAVRVAAVASAVFAGLVLGDLMLPYAGPWLAHVR